MKHISWFNFRISNFIIPFPLQFCDFNIEMDNILIQPSVAVIIASIIAFRAYRRKSLNLSGALAGFIVMSTHFAINYRFFNFTVLASLWESWILVVSFPNLISNSQFSSTVISCYREFFFLRYGAVLLVFFFTSSKLTKVGEEKKRVVDADFKEGGQRNW